MVGGDVEKRVHEEFTGPGWDDQAGVMACDMPVEELVWRVVEGSMMRIKKGLNWGVEAE